MCLPITINQIEGEVFLANNKDPELLHRRQKALEYVSLRIQSTKSLLNPFYLPLFEKLCDELEGTFWAPYSGYRSLEEQLKLFLKGRTTESIQANERIVTNALPGDSPHNWGCATDWVCFDPEYGHTGIWKLSPWNFYGETVRKSGLKWGGDFKSIKDKPHNELILDGCSWADIGTQYRENGEESARMMIEKHMRGLI